MSLWLLPLSVLFLVGCASVCPDSKVVAYVIVNRRIHCHGEAPLPTTNVLMRCTNGWEGLVPLEALQP